MDMRQKRSVTPAIRREQFHLQFTTSVRIIGTFNGDWINENAAVLSVFDAQVFQDERLSANNLAFGHWLK